MIIDWGVFLPSWCLARDRVTVSQPAQSQPHLKSAFTAVASWLVGCCSEDYPYSPPCVISVALNPKYNFGKCSKNNKIL